MAQKQKFNVFILDGEKYYDFNGYVISVKSYEELKAFKSHDLIILDNCKSLKHIVEYSLKKMEEEKHEKLIHNFSEYASFLLNEILPEDKANEIKTKKDSITKVKDFIELFPRVYRSLLRLRLMKDKRMMENANKEIESLEETLLTKNNGGYNPNAWIE